MTGRARQKGAQNEKGDERPSLRSDELLGYGLGWGELFDATDIDNLAKVAGHRLCDRRERESLAFLLTATFVDAGRAEMLGPVLTNRDFEPRFREIHEAASRLALLLGFERGGETPTLPAALSAKCGGSVYYRNDRIRNFRTIELAMLQRVADNRAAANPSSDAVSVSNGLQNLPEALAALINTSRPLTSAPAPRPRGGRPLKRGQQQLFMNLAEAFFYMFGIAPAMGRARDDPSEASLRWALDVIRLANDRISSQVMLNLSHDERRVRVQNHPAVMVAREAAALAPATVADRLSRGWKDLRSLASRNNPLEKLLFPLASKLATNLDGSDPGENSMFH